MTEIRKIFPDRIMNYRFQEGLPSDVILEENNSPTSVTLTNSMIEKLMANGRFQGLHKQISCGNLTYNGNTKENQLKSPLSQVATPKLIKCKSECKDYKIQVKKSLIKPPKQVKKQSSYSIGHSETGSHTNSQISRDQVGIQANSGYDSISSHIIRGSPPKSRFHNNHITIENADTVSSDYFYDS